MKEKLEKLEMEIERLKDAANDAAGESLATNLLIGALLAQSSDKPRLLKDFTESLEDSNIRTMYSSRPEAFFQALQRAGKVWQELIREALDSEAPRSRAPRQG